MPANCRGVVTAKIINYSIFIFMSKFNKLSRAEMKNVMGGTVDPNGCLTSECSDDAGCATSSYGKYCKKETCNATNLPANYCWKGAAA
jgi:hypothetical protein